MTVSVLLPAAGMGVTEATITSWLKAIGDRVEKGEIIAEMETAKTTVEIEAPVSGVLTDIAVEDGAMVEVDVQIATIEEA